MLLKNDRLSTVFFDQVLLPCPSPAAEDDRAEIELTISDLAQLPATPWPFSRKLARVL